MFAIAINALYTTLCRRGTTRQLTAVIVTCVFAALLLLPAIVWYNERFSVEQAALSFAEVEVVLVYVALWGWILPLSMTITYSLFTMPRSSHDSMHLPSHNRTASSDNANGKPLSALPQRPATRNTPVPFVFGEGTPWGWLEYRNGRFQGQQLALTQTVVKIGRAEDNDIWLDDDRALGYHAELTWSLGTVYITHYDGLNGVLLNGHPIHGSTIVRQGDVFEVGSHRFRFEYAERSNTLAEGGDPLQHHVRRTPITPVPMNRDPSIRTKPLEHDQPDEYATIASHLPDRVLNEPSQPWQETVALEPVAQPTPARSDKLSGAFMIRTGEMVGKSFLLDRPILTIGRGVESDVVINDVSISRLHAQVSRQANGDYVQDLASRNGTKVNDEPLQAPRLLRQGDIVCLGEVRMEYTSVSTGPTTPLLPLPLPSRAGSISNPVPLRLPSKPKP